MDILKKCPVCFSNNIRVLFPLYKYRKSLEITSFATSYQLAECQDCFIWFKLERPPQELLNQFYESMPVDTYDWEYKSRLPHEKIIDQMIIAMPENSSILDIGCWSGRLLAPHSSNYKTFGIEPNSFASVKAIERGINLLGTFVNKELLKDKTFDLITMIDVYEHVESPDELIFFLLNHLSKNGKLVLVTGGTDNIAVKLAGGTYWYFSCIPDHITFLNKKHIEYLKKIKSDIHITFKKIAHSKFHFKRFLFEFAWLLVWRYCNPNSSFKKNKLLMFFISNRFRNVKEITQCRTFKDHYLIEFKKKL